jgi:hypothetical protein
MLQTSLEHGKQGLLGSQEIAPADRMPAMRWASMAVVVLGLMGACKPHASSPAAGIDGGAPIQRSEVVPIALSDESLRRDGTGILWIKLRVTARASVDEATLLLVARCREGDVLYRDDASTDVGPLAAGAFVDRDQPFAQLALDQPPSVCQLTVSYQGDPMSSPASEPGGSLDLDASVPVETLCWVGGDVEGGPCTGLDVPTATAGAQGVGTVTVSNEKPHFDSSMSPWVRYDLTANQEIDDGEVQVDVSCTQGTTLLKARGLEMVSQLEPGDTLQEDTVAADITLPGTPSFCEYRFAFQKELLGDDGIPIAAICWKGGQVHDGPCL